MAKTFEHLEVFQSALELAVGIYEATTRFPSGERYGLSSQLRRASVSVVSHIAEGQGRLSWGEWRQLLSNARGSLYEIEAQLILARRLELLAETTHDSLRIRTRLTGRLLAGLIRYVQSGEASAKMKHQQQR
jgi:four helix bundle protein